jgi:hypothetical protein
MTPSLATRPVLAPDLPSEVRDVRPILTRTRDNAWERTEQIRADLYQQLDILCARRELEALVLQSPAYVHPAWVKFESWSPTGEQGITARSSVIVNILTRPYHRYEAIYKIDWEKHGQKGTFDHVYEFGESELGRLIDLLMAAPTPSRARRAVKRILKPVQLRQQWWQLWKPKNNVSIIRRDWPLMFCVSSIILGVALLAVPFQNQSTVSDDLFPSGLDTPVGPDPFAAAPAPEPPVAQPTPDPPPPDERAPASSGFARIQLGDQLSGALDDADNRLGDGRLYEARAFAASAGTPVSITMRSTDFDTFLIVGRLVGGAFETLQTNDDGGGDGTNSQLDFMPPVDGEYLVVASSLDAGKSGRYSLSVR